MPQRGLCTEKEEEEEEELPRHYVVSIVPGQKLINHVNRIPEWN